MSASSNAQSELRRERNKVNERTSLRWRNIRSGFSNLRQGPELGQHDNGVGERDLQVVFEETAHSGNAPACATGRPYVHGLPATWVPY
jgi:hypothetical protein